MQDKVVTVRPCDSLENALELLVNHDISGMPVVTGDGQLIGMLSEVDHLHGDFSGCVEQFMTTDPVSIDVETSVAEAAQMFRTIGVHRLPVTESGRVVGIIGCRDIVRFYQNLHEEIGSIAPLVQETPDYVQVSCNED